MCNIEKTYSDGAQSLNVLSNFNFEANEGEFISVVGPIRSGKSTILNILAGIEKINNGQVIINNVDITTLSADELGNFRHHNIGIILQHHALFPFLSCIEQVALPQIIAGVEETVAYQHASDVLKQLDIFDMKCCLPENLSQHEKQRVALASAIVQKPKILLVDELAVKSGRQDYLVLNFLKDINNLYGTTIFMVTKSQEVISRADRILEIPRI